MPSRRRLVRSKNDIALIEETIYVLVPLFAIETAYVITSKCRPTGAYFNSLAAANKEFERQILRSEGKQSVDI